VTRRRSPGPLDPLPPDLPPARAALAGELRIGREKAHLTLRDLAEKVYASRASISRWLSGRALPTGKQARMWADLCGTDPQTMEERWRAAVDAGPIRPRRHRRGYRESGRSTSDTGPGPAT
jgi:transcriptional regulator with XRE-family HTH domain